MHSAGPALDVFQTYQLICAYAAAFAAVAAIAGFLLRRRTLFLIGALGTLAFLLGFSTQSLSVMNTLNPLYPLGPDRPLVGGLLVAFLVIAVWFVVFFVAMCFGQYIRTSDKWPWLPKWIGGKHGSQS